MSARGYLADALKPLLPKAWKVLPYQDEIDATKVPVVLIGQTTVIRNPAAPLAARDHSLVVTLLSPVTDPAKADDVLEDALATLLLAIEQISKTGAYLKWDSADRATEGNLPAYDVTVTTTTPHRFGGIPNG